MFMGMGSSGTPGDGLARNDGDPSGSYMRQNQDEFGSNQINGGDRPGFGTPSMSISASTSGHKPTAALPIAPTPVPAPLSPSVSTSTHARGFNNVTRPVPMPGLASTATPPPPQSVPAPSSQAAIDSPHADGPSQEHYPLMSEEVKSEQARLLTLLRTLHPMLVVDRICKGLAYYGGTPGTSAHMDGVFPGSIKGNGSGRNFVSWLAEIFPGSSQTASPDILGPGAADAASELHRRPRGRPKGSKGSKVRKDKGIKKTRSSSMQMFQIKQESVGISGMFQDESQQQTDEGQEGDLEANLHGRGERSSLDNSPTHQEHLSLSIADFADLPPSAQQPDSPGHPQDAAPPKRRGRPKGSKNKPKSAMDPDQSSPLLSVVSPGAAGAELPDDDSPQAHSRRIGRPKGSKNRPKQTPTESTTGPEPDSSTGTALPVQQAMEEAQALGSALQDMPELQLSDPVPHSLQPQSGSPADDSGNNMFTGFQKRKSPHDQAEIPQLQATSLNNNNNNNNNPRQGRVTATPAAESSPLKRRRISHVMQQPQGARREGRPHAMTANHSQDATTVSHFSYTTHSHPQGEIGRQLDAGATGNGQGTLSTSLLLQGTKMVQPRQVDAMHHDAVVSVDGGRGPSKMTYGSPTSFLGTKQSMVMENGASYGISHGATSHQSFGPATRTYNVGAAMYNQSQFKEQGHGTLVGHHHSSQFANARMSSAHDPAPTLTPSERHRHAHRTDQAMGSGISQLQDYTQQYVGFSGTLTPATDPGQVDMDAANSYALTLPGVSGNGSSGELGTSGVSHGNPERPLSGHNTQQRFYQRKGVP